MGLLNMLFGNTKNMEKVQELLANGATIIDVRTPAEYQGGHVAGSKNIPLQEISGRVDEIMAIDAPVVFCCASGGRSGQATDFFKAKGLNCENGGPWTSVNKYV